MTQQITLYGINGNEIVPVDIFLLEDDNDCIRSLSIPLLITGYEVKEIDERKREKAKVKALARLVSEATL